MPGWKALRILALLVIAGCDLGYPEVVVVNKTSEYILLKNPSFNGCVWETVLAYGETTSPGRCLPGEDRIYFQKYDAEEYCREQVEDGTIDGLCQCGQGMGSEDPDLVNVEPMWFNYQTISLRRVDYGDFRVYEITLDDIEQDFSAPGPYGH